MKESHDGPLGAGSGSVVSGEDSTNHVYVDLYAEGVRDLLGDSHAAETRFTPLHLYNRCDELRRRTFGAGFAAIRRKGKEQPVLAFHQRLVELEQRRGLDEHAKYRNSVRANPECRQSEHEAIDRGEIRCTLLRAIADEQLLLQQQRLCRDSSRTPWA